MLSAIECVEFGIIDKKNLFDALNVMLLGIAELHNIMYRKLAGFQFPLVISGYPLYGRHWGRGPKYL